MESSIPKFENPEALEQYLENLKLQLLTSEFAALGKISQDSDHHKEKDSSNIDGKAQTQVKNSEFFMSKKNGLDGDINQEILSQSNFKLTKQDQNGQINNTSEAPRESDSEEAQTESQDFVNSSTQTDHTLNTQQGSTPCESQSGKIFSKEHAPQASSFNTQGCQTVPEQHNTNGFGRPKLIQPIYVVFPNQQVGYIEVDLSDENAMKNISGLLQKQPE